MSESSSEEDVGQGAAEKSTEHLQGATEKRTKGAYQTHIRNKKYEIVNTIYIQKTKKGQTHCLLCCRQVKKIARHLKGYHRICSDVVNDMIIAEKLTREKNQRAYRSCPICNKKVKDLNKHMQGTHQYLPAAQQEKVAKEAPKVITDIHAEKLRIKEATSDNHQYLFDLERFREHKLKLPISQSRGIVGEDNFLIRIGTHFRELDLDIEDIYHIHDKDGRDRFAYTMEAYAAHLLKRAKAGTVQMYMRAMRNFLEYLYDNDNPTRHYLNNLLHGLAKRGLGRLDTTKFVVDPEMRSKVDAVATSEKSLEIRNKILAGNAPFVQARNYLITTLTYVHGQRPKGVHGMTMQEFQNAIPNSEGTHKVIHVTDHKTAKSRGPVQLVFPNDDFHVLEAFVNNIRLPKDSNMVFFTSQGKVIQSSLATQLIAKHMKYCNPEIAKYTSNEYRKTIVTNIHTYHPDLRQAAASQMSHKIQTAEKHYMLATEVDRTVQSFKEIVKVTLPGAHAIMTTLDPETSADRTITDTETFDPPLTTPQPCTSQSLDTSARTVTDVHASGTISSDDGMNSSCETEREKSNAEGMSPDSDDLTTRADENELKTPSKVHSRRYFDLEDRLFVRSLFKDHIENKHTPTAAQIDERLTEEDIQRLRVNRNPISVRELHNKVRETIRSVVRNKNEQEQAAERKRSSH